MRISFSWVGSAATQAGVGRAGRAAAAILHEIADQCVHRFIVGAIDERAVAPLLPDQPGPAELGEVEGERGVRHAERPGDRTRRHALVPGLDEQPEQRQAMLLRERAERRDGGGAVH